MGSFKPKDPQFRSRVEASFNRQQVMKTLGVTIASLQPGEIELVMPYDVAAYTQQHGFSSNDQSHSRVEWYIWQACQDCQTLSLAGLASTWRPLASAIRGTQQ